MTTQRMLTLTMEIGREMLVSGAEVARVEDTITRMASQQGVDEALKRADPLAWAGRMNAIKNAAEEAVLPDLLYRDALE